MSESLRTPPPGDAKAPAKDLDVLDRRACYDLLAEQDVGRLAWQEQGRVFVFPLNYAVDGDDVLFCTTSSSVVRALTGGRDVAFQVDDLEPAVHVGWTVLVEGRGERVLDEAESARGAALVSPWRDLTGAAVLRLRPHRVSGRRIRERAAAVDEVYVAPVLVAPRVAADGWPTPFTALDHSSSLERSCLR